MLCEKSHRYDAEFADLPLDQGGHGRHACAACAYDRGFEAGLARKEGVNLDLESLPGSQAGTVRHKSPTVAWAHGYLDGARQSYETRHSEADTRDANLS